MSVRYLINSWKLAIPNKVSRCCVKSRLNFFMETKINIVIPSIQLSDELIYCLKKLNNQNYKNFFVTIVLDYKNNKKLPNLKYKLKIVVSGGRNMSFKET